MSLTVNALPPVAANDSFSTNVNTPLNVAASGVLSNDSDPQVLPLSAVLVSGPTNGSLTLNANGSFSYTPKANYFGGDRFTYQATDGLANSNIATVSLTINTLPPVAANDNFSTNVNTGSTWLSRVCWPTTATRKPWHSRPNLSADQPTAHSR